MIEVGQTVGNYIITARLGEGGMGTVFLAEHPVIGSKVALKAIHPQFARDTEVISRFMNEARSVNQIGHDHIVDITDFGNTPEGDFYFIMEHLDGRSLAECIAKDGPFPPARALNIAAQIADALTSSHEHGIIHRDLKPENIILIMRDEAMDFVKVLDFGLAKLTRPDAPLGHETGAGFVMGTPFYMAPEQCEGKADIDHRTDIYALGVMLFEMLTGKVPFGGRGYGDIIIKQMTVPPPAVRSLRPELSPALDLILYRAMAKTPGARFQSMAAFREALQDPESYSTAGNVSGVFEDLSLRVRQAMPMARAEVKLELAQTGAPVGMDGPAPSTFRSASGQVDDEDDPKPKRHRGRVGLLFGAAAIGGVALAGRQVRHDAKAFLVAAVSKKAPGTVLVTFNSDPNGATVATASGTVLGVTPLMTEVAFSETANEYVIRKDGYQAQIASIIPNLPSPFFAVLEPRVIARPPQMEPLALKPAPADVPQTTAAKERPTRKELPVTIEAKEPAAPEAPKEPEQAEEPEAPQTDRDGLMIPSAP